MENLCFLQREFVDFWNRVMDILNASSGQSVFGDLHSMTVFILACFVGYYVVWRVTPALHAPLMAVTNAISSVIVVGAISATAQHFFEHACIFGFIAVMLLSINIFGGFIVTQRMLNMFKKKTISKN